MKKILEAIRADTQLQALVEAKAGVSVPAPCQCKCVLLRAVAFALLLSYVRGRAAGHGRLALRLLLLQVLEVLPRRLLRPEARRGAGGLRRALRHREAAALEPPRRVARVLSCISQKPTPHTPPRSLS